MGHWTGRDLKVMCVVSGKGGGRRAAAASLGAYIYALRGGEWEYVGCRKFRCLGRAWHVIECTLTMTSVAWHEAHLNRDIALPA